jgi:Domain of unknown function (DUF4365)
MIQATLIAGYFGSDCSMAQQMVASATIPQHLQDLKRSRGNMATSGMSENEQKQQLSVAYVHAVAARAGFACQVINVDDDSIDIQVAARGKVHHKSVFRSPKIDVQLKATSQDLISSNYLAFPLPIKNYDELRLEALVPRMLVVLVLPKDQSHWLEQTEDQMVSRRCAYWKSLLGQPETTNSTTTTVRLPRDQCLTAEALRGLMERASRREPL